MPHLLAVFGAEIARPPRGLELSQCVHPAHPSAEEVLAHEAACLRILQADVSKAASRELKMPGKGCGFSYSHSPYCSYASKDGVHVIMSGEVSQWPNLDAVSVAHNAFVRNEAPPEEDDAHWLLDFYRTFTEPGVEEEVFAATSEAVMNRALDCLAAVQGTFAFIIYDSVRHRVLAARDREGTCPLFWGATSTGQLLFGTELVDLNESNPTATAFPAGCLFTSERNMIAFNPGEAGWVIEGDEVPGDLFSFVTAEDAQHFKGVKVIPRITSKGALCGVVYRISSTADMSRPCPQH